MYLTSTYMSLSASAKTRCQIEPRTHHPQHPPLYARCSYIQYSSISMIIARIDAIQMHEILRFLVCSQWQGDKGGLFRYNAIYSKMRRKKTWRCEAVADGKLTSLRDVFIYGILLRIVYRFVNGITACKGIHLGL